MLFDGIDGRDWHPSISLDATFPIIQSCGSNATGKPEKYRDAILYRKWYMGIQVGRRFSWVWRETVQKASLEQ